MTISSSPQQPGRRAESHYTISAGGKGGKVSHSIWNIVQAFPQKVAQLNSADAGAVASGVVSASGAKTIVGGRIC